MKWVSLTVLPVLMLAACAANKGAAARPQISDCCTVFGIDVNPVLGENAVNCGTINSKPRSAAARSKNRKVVSCARRAQSRGAAVVFDQGYSATPDYYLRNVLVFGAQGEKILVVIEYEHDGPSVFAGPCDVLKVLDNGDLEYSGCRTDEALLDRMKPGQIASER
jgi:hypothetical protein